MNFRKFLVALALCALFINLQDPSAAVRSLPEEDVEPRFLKEEQQKEEHPIFGPENPMFGPNENCSEFEEIKNSPVSTFMRRTECEVSKAIFICMGGPPALVAAFILNIIYHVTRCVQKVRTGPGLNPFLRELSVSVMVFVIFYSESLGKLVKGNKFFMSSVVVIIEALFFQAVDLVPYCFPLPEPNTEPHPEVSDQESPLTSTVDELRPSQQAEDAELGGQQAEQEKERKKMDELQVVNRYQLPTASFATLCFLFTCQVTLGLFYLYSFNVRKDDFFNFTSGCRWLIGFLLCTIAGEQEVGNAFDLPFWLGVLRSKDRRITGSLEQPRKRQVLFLLLRFKTEFVWRMLMSAAVNLLIRRIIFCTMPILLSVQKSPLDFIKDCLAVFFITKLDELDQPMDFNMVLERTEQKHRKMQQDGTLASRCKWLWSTIHQGNDQSPLITERVFEKELMTTEMFFKQKIEALEKRIEKRIRVLENKRG